MMVSRPVPLAPASVNSAGLTGASNSRNVGNSASDLSSSHLLQPTNAFVSALSGATDSSFSNAAATAAAMLAQQSVAAAAAAAAAASTGSPLSPMLRMVAILNPGVVNTSVANVNGSIFCSPNNSNGLSAFSPNSSNFSCQASNAAVASAAAAVYHHSSPLQHSTVSSHTLNGGNDLLIMQKPHHQSAFRPIVPSSDSFFLSAIHSFVLNSPNEDSPSESGPSSDKCGSADDTSNSGTTTALMCQVCSDRASGFHYGVFACEGCKGFFRRSIQQKIQYRPCTRAQECLIVRNNRNRCQYCRLKKCISVGMSRDAVRFGRVPKREKAKMVEEMQRTSAQSQLDAMAVQFENENEAIERIQAAFQQLIQQLDVITVPLPGKCPLQLSSYLVAIKAVVDFANAIPGFLCLMQSERIQILKSCVFDVLLVAYSHRAECLPSFLSNSPFLVQSIAAFGQRIRGLPSSALALLAAVFVVQPNSQSVDQLYQSNSNGTGSNPSPLINLLSERVWLLLARIIGPLTLTLAPSLLADVRTLRAWHNEYLRPAPPAAPLTPLSLPSPPTPTAPSSAPAASTASNNIVMTGCNPLTPTGHSIKQQNQIHLVNHANFIIQNQPSVHSPSANRNHSTSSNLLVNADMNGSSLCPINGQHGGSCSGASSSSSSGSASCIGDAEARRSFRERHSSIASLLEKPVMPLLSPSTSSSRSESHLPQRNVLSDESLLTTSPSSTSSASSAASASLFGLVPLVNQVVTTATSSARD